VRHPDVGKNLCRDIDLMFKFSRFLSRFSKFFEIPITEHSIKRILSDQLLFLKEKRNLDQFRTVVVDRNVKFPYVYPLSTNLVLI
jgi:predicted unusual protein kinase regulating ubiquinone biosynthesis (AarF/ABC1/UbiB family)